MQHIKRPKTMVRAALACSALALVAACQEPIDFDLRELGRGFDTTSALADIPPRPMPDNRGIISYPNYQVAVAQSGDTVRSVATRLQLNANELAGYNGIEADAPLRAGEVIALPTRVAEPSPATGAETTGPIRPATPVDVTTLAGDAIDRAGQVTTTPLDSATSVPAGTEPERYQVQPGDTVYSIARRYNVSATAIADWNGLGADLTVREGQFLMIPPGGSAIAPPPSTDIAAPGVGSETPLPPSAADPLPEPDVLTQPATEPAVTPETTPAPDLGAQQTPTVSDAPMVRPVSGSIIRAYAPGRNDGIDIGAPAGTEVSAAADGTVAAITTDTSGIQIVVIRHDGNLLTVYTHLENLTVERGSTVRQGQTIGQVRAGDPSFLHFEVRRGTDAQDPDDFLR